MQKTMDIFGQLVFNQSLMKTRLSKKAYEVLMETISKNTSLDKDIAGEIAHSIKEWAIENGATHFTHWFQPLQEGTAEKHTAFISYNDEGELIERLSAEQLIQSKPEASPFQSSGIRSTFEARGYTTWDPTSPVFLIEGKNTKTLIIPSIFLSWTGEILDQKTTLLKSIKSLNDVGIKIQKLLGNRSAKRIKLWLGIEQEYFLIPKTLFESRPDLKNCNRTLFGVTTSNSQHVKNLYFGTITDKILNFLEDFDHELFKNGIPAKTRHNEVSPNQFEIAPLYEELNLAVDHNLQLMNLLKKVADKHDLVAILHEKPFKGVNGSSKHLNWSIGDNTGVNYLEPSASPLRNVTLLMTIVSLMLGVSKYGTLLRAAVAEAGNDDRLGSSEAPPKIISIFLGDYLTSILDRINTNKKFSEKLLNQISLEIRQLPSIIKDSSDINRISPIAFTGDKFEFRVSGSSQNCSEAITMFNVLIAYGYNRFYEKLVDMKGEPKANVLAAIKEFLEEAKKAQFEGNYYSKEWQIEAKKRGLDNIENTPSALTEMCKPKYIALLSEMDILNEQELIARRNIKLKKYIRTRQTEASTACYIAKSIVQPAILKHITMLGQAYSAIISAGVNSKSIKKDIEELETLYTQISNMIDTIIKRADLKTEMTDIIQIANEYTDLKQNEVNVLRSYVDTVESIIDKSLWPMATYQEIFNSI
ncbi:MAG: hypothetical protein A2Y40_04660 [Candidatus Margulisbacteria bacterium GWF2_35_9]|nr:MAG: hypothetical protein A2Y40_04660 [Candidatus Margulisbacteria bacterium GWF2_35_9]